MLLQQLQLVVDQVQVQKGGGVFPAWGTAVAMIQFNGVAAGTLMCKQQNEQSDSICNRQACLTYALAQ